MNQATKNFDTYAFSKQAGYDEATVRKEFAQLMPLRTIVIYCYDPRAMGIPDAVAKELGEVYPGEVVTDEDGNGIATTATLLRVVVAGGRAIDALRSITVGQHLLGVENIVVVHHTYCGATSYTKKGIINAYQHEHDVDISDLYEHDSVCIDDYIKSLQHDTRLLRESKGTPQHVNIYGYVYDIDTHDLSLITESKGIDRSPTSVM